MKCTCSDLLSFLQGHLTRLRRFGWSEVILLVAALLALFCGYCFIKLADEVKDGETQTVDEWVRYSLRRSTTRRTTMPMTIEVSNVVEGPTIRPTTMRMMIEAGAAVAALQIASRSWFS